MAIMGKGKSGAVDKYAELVMKVDEFSRQATEAAGREVACRPGCDECCRASFTVFRVEAQNLLAGFNRLSARRQRLIRDRCAGKVPAPPGCALLDNGQCMLYDHRPLICRTHGLPLRSGHLSVGGSNTTAVCPKNFRTPGALEGLNSGYILDLDTLNAVLSAINMLYMKESGCGPGNADCSERIAIADIFI